MTDAPPAWPACSIEQAHALMTAPGSILETEVVDIRGVPTRVWKSPPHTLKDIFEHSRVWAARDFLVYQDERATYGDFHKAVAALAARLAADGVTKGDRVALVMRNLPEWPVAFFAAGLVGAIVTPLNAWWTGPELEYGLIDCGAKLAICDAQRLARMALHLPNCPELKKVYVARMGEEIAHPSVAKLESVIGEVNAWKDLPEIPLPDVELLPEDDATIFYTSGTTGEPKGALGTHRNLSTNILTLGVSLARSHVRRGEAPPEPDLSVQKRGLVSIPYFHVTGCVALLLPAVFAGARLVMMRKWDPEEAFALIEREQITNAGGVPTIAWQLVEHPAREKYDLTSLETVSYGGAPAAAELVRRLREVFPHSSPGSGWGMTETSATCTHHYGEDYVHRPDSCGPAAPVCEIKVVDADGKTLPPGEVGELMAFGPNIVKGYWNKPEATAQTFVDGWVRTGDLARIDEDGFCFIVDRAKDMIIRGGENIYSAEVEAVLYEHPDVLDAALVAVPHKTLGEEPAAVVTLRRDSTAGEDDLRAWVADRLAAFKVPVRVITTAELLPRNANGKVLKAELRKLFQ